MKNAFGTERLVALLKCLMAAYLITGVLLLAVAGVLYKFSIGENIVDISIIVIYCISSLLAGLFFSKGAPQIYLGNVGGSDILFDYLCSFCSGRTQFYAIEQCLCHNTFYLSWQWDVGRNVGITIHDILPYISVFRIINIL